MKDSISFPLLLATVLAGVLLTIFDPANRDANLVASKSRASASSFPSLTVSTTSHQPS